MMTDFIYHWNAFMKVKVSKLSYNDRVVLTKTFGKYVDYNLGKPRLVANFEKGTLCPFLMHLI